MNDKAAIILAAGRSTRMKTDIPKVLHDVCGRPMLAYVLDACHAVGIQKILVVVGFGKNSVIETFADESDICWVHQDEQLGTGHAVMCCAEALKGFAGDILVLCGDGPLIRPVSLEVLLQTHRDQDAQATMMTAILDDPDGYGRICRDQHGQLLGIVEQPDCSEEQLTIREINPSYYCFDAKTLFEMLKKTRSDNTQGEYYVTDVLQLVLESGRKAVAIEGVAAQDVLSINSREQLAQVNKIMQQRTAKEKTKC